MCLIVYRSLLASRKDGETPTGGVEYGTDLADTVFHLQIAPSHGKFVVVMLNSTNETTFKQLVVKASAST